MSETIERLATIGESDQSERSLAVRKGRHIAAELLPSAPHHLATLFSGW